MKSLSTTIDNISQVGTAAAFVGVCPAPRNDSSIFDPERTRRQPPRHRHGLSSRGYSYASKSGTWKLVWIALFPSGAPAGDSMEIPVVLTSYNIGDEAALQQLLQSGYVTGICSERPSSSWGSRLGTELVMANPGSQHSSAWIIEEMRDPPSATFVTELLIGSAGCFAAVIVFAMILFWKAG